MSNKGKSITTDEHGNNIHYDYDKKLAKQELSFYDENGILITGDVQSSRHSTDKSNTQKTSVSFDGFMVTPMNVNSHIQGDCMNRTPEFKKLLAAAKKYCEQHPECFVGFKDNETSLISSYEKAQLQNYIHKRVEEGNASALEVLCDKQYQAWIEARRKKLKGMAYDENDIKNAHMYCWEQITGAMSPDASPEEVQAANNRSDLTQSLTEQAEELKKSADRGEISIKNRVAQAQNARYELHFSSRGDSGKTMTVTRTHGQNSQTMNEDEMHYVVRRYSLKLGQEHD